MVRSVAIGQMVGGKKVLAAVNLSNGWQVVKTEDKKSPRDFKVKVINPQHPKGLTVKHAHFAIDFYGKLCQDEEKAIKVLEAIGEVWRGRSVKDVVEEYEPQIQELSGYPLEYILHALNWILEQEDINFKGRSEEKQKEIDEKIKKLGIEPPKDRKGSQLEITLLCDIASGTHTVEAFYRAGLKI
ncbi:MAG: hypothetical protein QXH47_04455 [Candidatus Bathyarchaeia archaeon]